MRASPPAGNRAGTARRIGLISDTHGLLRPEARTALGGVDLIIHAGDIGSPQILDELAAIAPVRAVRGNNDRGAWARGLAPSLDLVIGALHLHVIHDIHELREDALARATRVVISGHSHRPQVIERSGRLWVNPGSAGPRRFRLPVTVAELRIARDRAAARILTLL